MNRPQIVNRIFRELRSELGEQFPAYELLESAAKLAEIIDDSGPVTGARLQTARATFNERPVDEVIADGGWRVLSREFSWVNQIDGDDTLSVCGISQLRNYGLEMAA
jgi:hypothetical protein